MNNPSSHSADQPAAPALPPSSESAPTADQAPVRQAIPPLGLDPYIRATTPPEILEAQETFFRDLPQLLQERPGQWVAYYGKARLGFGKTSRALHDECVRQGYPTAMIRRIRSYPETDYISAL